MPQANEEVISKMEGELDGLLKQLDDVLKLHAAPGAPHSDDEGMTGAGKHNTAGHQRKTTHHDQQPDKEEDPPNLRSRMGKAKKKSADDSDDGDDGDDDDMDKMLANIEKVLFKAKKKSADDGDDGDGSDDDEDDWSEPATSKTKKALEDEDTLVIEGQRIAKADVGETQFEIFKAMDARLKKADEEIQKAKDETEMAKLSKRADEEFAHVPGTTAERAQMLKAIGSMPKEMQKAFGAVFKQSEKLAGTAFGKIGSSGVSPDDLKNGAGFEAKVAEIQKRDTCTRTEALAKARKEDPEAFKTFQGQN